MHNWTWQTWQGKSYLTCELIPQPHGFFTSAFAPMLPAALTPALAPAAEVLRAKQVHGSVVLSALEIQASTKTLVASAVDGSLPDQDIQRPQADGCFSTRSGQAAWVCTADCTPALIADGRTGMVAAVHAGWRGTAQGIVPVAVAKLQAQGSQLRDLRVLLGPAIAGDVYQVGEDVAVAAGRSLVDTDRFTTDAALLDHLLAIDNPPLQPDGKSGHVRLDVRRINQMQLTQLGLSLEQVAIAPHCTYQEPERFFSYRRTQRKQIQWSGIVSV